MALRRRMTLAAAALACGSAIYDPLSAQQAPSAGDSAPFALTADQALSWTPTSTLANSNNRSRIALAPRFTDPDSKLDPRLRVMFAPDGMNNLGDVFTSQPKFNLYNFVHWAQIDVFAWFAGTAHDTVNIPARPWIEAAHRNGVKVIGVVYFGQVQYGGTATTVKTFLKQDGDGSFPAAKRLVQIARYYGFDGWLINAETDLLIGRDPAIAASDARKVQLFLRYLTRIAPKPMEIDFVEALLPDGSMKWQNGLTRKNTAFLLDRPRVSDGIWLNYWWSPADLARSAAIAERAGRSRYDLFIGADLGPSRDNAQAAFRNRDWIRNLYPDGTRAIGSLAIFDPNFNFDFEGDARTQRFSRYKDDPSDVGSFYDTETRLFAGDDLNMAVVDAPSTWPGISSAVPARSTIMTLPFATNFNTGQGLHDAVAGRLLGHPWHDVSRQAVLPTWQFAFSNGAPLHVAYDFERPYEGGNSLKISIEPSNEDTEIPLFLTALRLKSRVRLSVVTETAGAERFKLRLALSDGTIRTLSLPSSERWTSSNWQLDPYVGKTIRRISVVAAAAGEEARVNIGRLAIER